MKVKYLCVGMCGEIELEKMKLHSDGSLICPRCGGCQWYIIPRKKEKEGKDDD